MFLGRVVLCGSQEVDGDLDAVRLELAGQPLVEREHQFGFADQDVAGWLILFANAYSAANRQR